jgi:predicted AAA+ superfamily ATPase
MQFLELPIQVVYMPKKNHQFLAGVYTAYLLSTKNTVIHHFQTETIGEIKHITNATNHMEGFHRADYGLTLGYEYEIFKSLAIGATANIGLRDLTNNKTLESNSRDFNHQIRVHVNYSFW